MKEDADLQLLVSVIIPVYNVAPYLRQALDSVINQTYKHLEIIVIDDDSSDGSDEICDEYARKDERIRVIHQENRGLSAVRNRGLEMMTGDAVVFLDPDDAYHLDYVGQMVSALVRTKADMVVSKYSIHHTTRQMKWKEKKRTYPSWNANVYDRYNALQALFNGDLNVNVWNKMYRSELWDTIRFFEGHVYEDVEIAYKITERCDSVCVMNDHLYLHRKRPGSITTTKSLQNAKDQILARNRVKDFIASRVPKYFTEEQLQKKLERNMVANINTYLSCLSKNTKEWRMFKAELKSIIIEQTRALKTLDFRIKMASFMVQYCPWLLRIAFMIYFTTRKVTRRILGK